MNFKAIPYMKQKFNCPVGYTPQGRDYDMDFMSIGLGVNILEKRLTVDRSIPQNGHIKALEPQEFSLWVKRVRELETALGLFTILPTDSDKELSKVGFKSLYVNKDVKKGEIITNEKISARRPGDGIPSELIDNVCGKKALHNIKKESKIKWDDIY